MSDLLDWIRPDEMLTLIVLITLLVFTGQQLTSPGSAAYRQARRFAGAAILLYASLAIHSWRPSTAAALLDVVTRSLMAGGVAFGTGLMILGVLGNLLGDPIEAFRRWCREWKIENARRAQESRATREAGERLRREQEELERCRPEREAEAARQLIDKVRRENARLACETLYALAAPEIGSKFSKQELSDFMARYMSDSEPPEVVEERAKQLEGIIRHHWERCEAPRRSLTELSHWFEERLSELQSVPDARLRESLSVQLKVRYSDLMSERMSEIRP